MKICDKCGAQQSDARIFCVDCNEKLGDSISKDRLQEIKKETQEKIDKINNKADPLYVNISDKVVGFVSLIGLVIILFFMIIYRHNLDNALESIYSIMFFVLCALNALAPKILWALEKFRLSLTISSADDAEPSDFYRIMRKIVIYGCFIFAVVFLVVTIFNLINRPDFTPNINILYQ